MIDILTVVFHEELPILKVQAQSISLYCKDLGIKNIFVIVNDSDDLADKIDINWYGDFSDCVRIVPRSKLGEYYHADGWMSQQYLKLKGSTLSKNEWVMVVDAKSIFIKEILVKELIDDIGRVKLDYHPLSEGWNPAIKNANSIFDIELKGVNSVVPYFFKPDLVSDLIKKIETEVKQSFDRWFQSFTNDGISETILYCAYIQWRYKSLDRYFNYKQRVFCQELIAPYLGKDANILFEERFSHKNQYMMTVWHVIMIHRKSWEIFTEENKKKYRDFLVSRKITCAKDL